MKKKTTSLFVLDLNKFNTYCGIDEAGRGPLAGSLVFAGVILKSNIEGLKDSKKLSEKRRENLYEIIKKNSNWFIYEVNSQKIDEIGLSKSIKEALEAIKKHFIGEKFLYDGNSSFGVSDIETLVKADDKVESVKAASILAKVYRDREMRKYAKEYPDYGFEKHKGYGTAKHIEAIKKYGLCPIHRKSFKLCK